MSDAVSVILWPATLTDSGGVQACATAEALGEALVIRYQVNRRLLSLTDGAGETLPGITLLRAALLDFCGPERFPLIWK